MVLILAGLLSGIISGMGIGGGTILIPALILFMGTGQHTAQSVNLLYFIPTSIVALIIHIKNRMIDFKIAIPIIISGVFGAAAGAWLATSFPGNALKKLFAVFLLAMGIYEMLRNSVKNKQG
ncbi:MAG: sulfite exporter TauE/SafE family protein [Clostridiaceae bacterium]|nr:sulfite exporter TauE/SafE family protein [Clostridiaceae bacterium]